MLLSITHPELFSSRCRDFFQGGYELFALGDFPSRSFVSGGPDGLRP